MKPDFILPKPDAPCPCGTGKTLAQCCGPVLKGERPAETAEALMRSRFTAHVARDWAYLHRSHLESSKTPYEPGPAQGEPPAWTRLEIHSHTPGLKPDQAYVDFTAWHLEEGKEQPFHEKGEFQKVDGTWYYVRPVREGAAPIRATAPKVGRNDPCPCGSGKKFKQCCGRA